MRDTRATRRLDFVYSASQRELFQRGVLWKEWSERYAELFDEDDIRLMAARTPFHFYEWLAAVLLFESTGWLSLVEKYDCKNHSRKQRILKETVGEELFQWLCANNDGLPDLFVYKPGKREWFFCEVKGAGDKVRPHQDGRFEELYERTGRPVTILHLSELASST